MKHEHKPAHEHHKGKGRAHDGHTHDHRRIAGRRLVACIVITGLMMLAEMAGGIMSNSLALISDAGHMMTHFVALAVSLFAIRLTTRPPTDRRSYGYFRAEILAAFTNGIFLVGITIYIIYEAVMRTIHPEEIQTNEMLAVALAGLIVNLVTALLLSGAGRRDLNIRSAFLHMIGDTLSSVAIVLGGIIMLYTGWFIIDPLLSGLICVLILFWAYKLLKESAGVLLEFAPRGLKAAEVAAALKTIDGINDVHDLHIWEITSDMNAMTAHVAVGDISVARTEEIRKTAAAEMADEFNIGHIVLQFETGVPA